MSRFSRKVNISQYVCINKQHIPLISNTCLFPGAEILSIYFKHLCSANMNLFCFTAACRHFTSRLPLITQAESPRDLSKNYVGLQSRFGEDDFLNIALQPHTSRGAVFFVFIITNTSWQTLCSQRHRVHNMHISCLSVTELTLWGNQQEILLNS